MASHKNNLFNISAIKRRLDDIIKKHKDNKELIDSNYSSDNTGDVYSAGLSDGEASLAKQLLEDFFDV